MKEASPPKPARPCQRLSRNYRHGDEGLIPCASDRLPGRETPVRVYRDLTQAASDGNRVQLRKLAETLRVGRDDLV